MTECASSREAATRRRTSRTCSPPSTRSCSTASHSRSARRGSAGRATRQRAAGLAVAERADSQEACFLAGDDYRSFLERQGLDRRPGPIVDQDGVELGRHDGLWRYTPGQRRGIGIAAAVPLHVLRGDVATNTLTVGPRSALEVSEVTARGRLYLPVDRVEAKLRYRSTTVPASVDRHG